MKLRSCRKKLLSIAKSAILVVSLKLSAGTVGSDTYPPYRRGDWRDDQISGGNVAGRCAITIKTPHFINKYLYVDGVWGDHFGVVRTA